MTPEVHCPKCSSGNVIFSKKRGAYLCEDCGHILPRSSRGDEAQTSSVPVAPLRIFLSYGHDANEELVRRIYADLNQRGHDVWFDKNEIKFGDEWRRAITDGILHSNRVLSFLSKHSTRDPGVCLDEIAIAIGAKGGNIQTILVESEREVKPPPSISHLQWLDMHDWKERRAAGEAAWESWYQAKLAEIVLVVESDESRRFAGEIKTLEELLKPTASDFAADARIRQLLEKKLVGRTWLFEAVEKWRTASNGGPSGTDSRLFWLMGAPGIGKSAFAAHLAHEYGRGTVIAVQFCDWKKPDHRDACRIIRTLAFQIATRLPDYRKLLLTLPSMTELDRKNSAELFDGLLTNPLKLSITGGRERYLIVIDALDEAGSASAQGGDGRNELVEVLARYAGQLPDWIGLVVTSRPEFDVTTPFQALKPFPFKTKSAANSDDIRAYLRRELAAQLQNRPDADRLVEQILEKSEGVFLYVESFCEDIRKNHLSLDRPNEFPQGLAGKFYMDFQRYFPYLEKFRKDVRPALRAILAAREPLPVEILQKLFNWQDEELRDFTRPLTSLFPVTTEACSRMTHYDVAFPHLRSIHYATPITDLKVIKAYHKSLADWLSNEGQAGSYFVSSKEGHRSLAELGCKELSQTPRVMSPYFICNLPQHLAAMGDVARLRDLLKDQWFWEHSPVFYRDQFYECLAQIMSPEDVLTAIAPVHSFFAQQAEAISPTNLGYTLFPHEPGVTFDGGTPVYAATDTGMSLEYTIPRGATEPPMDVLYDFVKCCHSTFLSASAFLRGVPKPAIADWYRNFWKQSRLQATLDAIENYYGFCGLSLPHRAMELSRQIDEALKKTQN